MCRPRPLLAALAGAALALPARAQGPAVDVAPFRGAAERIVAAALADSAAFERMAYVGDTFGHRLSGSAALEAAIDWVLAQMRADGLEGVRGQPAMVPHWV